MSDDSSKAARVSTRIVGRVQGVWYRKFAQDEAQNLGLTGWVRNERDGAVALEAEGRRSDLEILLEKLHQGPPFARVDKIDTQWSTALGDWSDFEIRY